MIGEELAFIPPLGGDVSRKDYDEGFSRQNCIFGGPLQLRSPLFPRHQKQ